MSMAQYFLLSWFLLSSFSFFFAFKGFSRPLDQFGVKPFAKICPWHNMFYLLYREGFFRTIWIVDLCKNIFVLYPHMAINFEFRVFIIVLNTIVNINTPLNISRFHFDCLMIYVVVFVNYIIQLISISIFWYCSHTLVDFGLQDPKQSFCNN